tara:strand:+ start:477 stop:971 length:495 start_codon:yes stop_codon:yes gene_type:complete
MELKMRKKLIISLLFLFLFIFACGEDINIYEPEISSTRIDFPFEERKSGKFSVIYQNISEDSVNYNLALVSKPGAIIENSNSLDFCEGIIALRQGKQVLEWILINLNYSAVPESTVLNENDHPNLVSYNLPKGTYAVMLTDSEICNKDNYKIFNITQDLEIENQ